MDAKRLERARQIVVERLMHGEPLETLQNELRKKLDDAAAQEIVEAAMQEIASRRASQDWEGGVRRAQKTRFGADYLAWRILASVLIVVGVATSLTNMMDRQAFTVAIGPLAVGIVIFGIVEWRVNTRVLAAKEAVDGLVEGEHTGPV